MKQTAIEKRASFGLKEKGQYTIAFGVVGVMLWFVGFPVFLLFFLGVLGFFLWKGFSSENRGDARKIFEFYLSANEILRDDERRWFGFEVQETITCGETIARSMTTAPPLVNFALGALYQKLGDHTSAIKHLNQSLESPSADELSVVFPSRELREYVLMLRRIERAPAEAPLTSSAVRSLERARKNRGRNMLDLSRAQLAQKAPQLGEFDTVPQSIVDSAEKERVAAYPPDASPNGDLPPRRMNGSVTDREPRSRKRSSSRERKTISEVLHDIYDNTA